MPVTQDIATISATSSRNSTLENVPCESRAQRRRNRLVCGRQASV